MSRTVLVVAEIRNGVLRPVSLEAIGAAAQIAQGEPGAAAIAAIAAVVIGPAPDEAAQQLIAAGAQQVYLVTGESLAEYNPEAYLAALDKVCAEVHPGAVLFGHTAAGRDLAPALAARLEAGMVSDVTALTVEGDRVLFTRPIYAGKAITRRVFREGAIIATIRPNNLPAPAQDASRQGEVKRINLELAKAGLRTIVAEVVRKAAAGVDLTAAKVVVAGGRGVKSADGFKPLQELAGLLGAAVGASRAACDAGYCDYSLQVGQTGKTVTPDLYIACGISGAIQHVAGMSSSKVVVAINKDPEAPIFKVADYGIVGDLFEVVPLLTQEFRQLLA
ncbi:MAG: electron transfer flavoprotein subunit alpha/FixB family protein [Firmicutes bacterium]|nr:electron transfer flavoprotein subunit alpha/FixB family protein [Bacillota bacterium]